jgi:hypothetical protein
VSAPEALAVTGETPPTDPTGRGRARRAASSDLEGTQQSVYVELLKPAFEAAQGSAPTALTHAQFEARFRLALDWLFTNQLNGLDMPVTTQKVLDGKDALGLLVVKNALADCRAKASIGLARNYVVQSTTAVQLGVPVTGQTIVDGHDHCLRFQLDYDVTLDEQGTFLPKELENPDPYMITADLQSTPGTIKLPVEPGGTPVPWQAQVTRKFGADTCTVSAGGADVFASLPVLPDSSLTGARESGPNVTLGLALTFGPPGIADMRPPGETDPTFVSPGCPITAHGYRQRWRTNLALKACIRPFGSHNAGDEPTLYLEELTGSPGAASASETHAGECYDYTNANRPAKLAWDATFTVTHTPN